MRKRWRRAGAIQIRSQNPRVVGRRRRPRQRADAPARGTVFTIIAPVLGATLRAWLRLVRCRCGTQLRPNAGPLRIVCAPYLIGRSRGAQVCSIAKDRTMREVT